MLLAWYFGYQAITVIMVAVGMGLAHLRKGSALRDKLE